MDGGRLDCDLLVRPDGLLAEALSDLSPHVALVLGSGLSGIADALDVALDISFADLPLVPRPTTGVVGHAGRLLLGRIGGVAVAVFRGRFHAYQGLSAYDVAYPARLAAGIGASILVLTNAAGGVSEDLRTGDVVLISDHINLMGANPLVGWSGPKGGTPFVSMCDAYDPDLRAVARRSASKLGMELKDGVYAGLLGPSYETPAEVAMLRAIGADVVGMSTVPEVIAARALGLRALGFSLVTNVAAGEGLSHAEVLKVGRRGEAEFVRLMLATIASLQGSTGRG